MKRSLLRSILADMISNLDEIISSESEEAYGLPKLKKCRADLKEVLGAIEARNKTFDFQSVLLRVYRLIDCIHFWVMGRR